MMHPESSRTVVRPVANAADPLAERARERYGDPLGRAVVPPRCHIYLRVSSPEQDRPRGRTGRRARTTAATQEREMLRSLDTQQQEAERYAERMGYQVVAVYRETFSSLEFWSRPRLADLRRAIAAGEVDVMLCLKMERLGATSIQLAVLEDLLQRHGGRLEFVQQTFDDSGMGRIGKTVYAEFNTFRIENLREQFSRAKAARVQNGEPLHGSYPPYGCAWTDDEHIAYRWQEPEITYVREVFERFDAGWSLGRLAKWLTSRGIPAPRGGPVWRPGALSAVILRNPIYCGRPMANRWLSTLHPGATATGKRKRTSRLRPADHERPPQPLDMPMEGEPPVAPDAFDRVQARLDANAAADAAAREARRNGAPRPADTRAGESRGGRPVKDPAAPVGVLLRGGYLRCAECEGPLSINQPGRYGCRANREGPLPDGTKRCRQPVSVDARLAEDRVWAEVLTFSQKGDAVESLLLAYAEARKASADVLDALAEDVASLRAQVAKIGRKTENLVGELADAGPFVRESIRASLGKLERDAAEARTALGDAEARLDAAERAGDEGGQWAAAVREMGGWLADPEVAKDPRNRRLAVEIFSPITTVYRPEKAGLGARNRRMETEFPPDRARYAQLRGALPWQTMQPDATRGGTIGLPPVEGSLRLRLTADGGLRVA